MRGDKNILARLDWGLVLLYLLFVVIGWINIYAAVYNTEHQSIFDISQNYGKQLIWIITAVVLAIAVLLMDSRFFAVFSYHIYVTLIFFLVLVLLFGKEVAGSKSWFAIGAFSLQPSEFAKFATCIVIAKYLSSLGAKFRHARSKIVTALFLIVPMVLILLQPDAGSALVYISFVFVLYREGLSGNFLLAGLFAVLLFIITLMLQNTFFELPFDIAISGKMILVFIIALIIGIIYLILKSNRASKAKSNTSLVTIMILVFCLSAGFIYSVDYAFDNLLSTHQRDRINELLAIRSDPSGTGYNVNQSKISIGSGGFTGKGFLQGTQTKYDFVPEQSTDFIFCTIGEEWGFVGSTVFIAIFVLLLWRITVIAERQRSRFSRVYAYGILSILAFHFMLNIGMTIGIMPVIGIPLPFISYGGSSLWTFIILVALLLRFDMNRNEIIR